MNLGMNFECVLKDSPNQRFDVTNTRTFEFEYNYVILLWWKYGTSLYMVLFKAIF